MTPYKHNPTAAERQRHIKVAHHRLEGAKAALYAATKRGDEARVHYWQGQVELEQASLDILLPREIS